LISRCFLCLQHIAIRQDLTLYNSNGESGNGNLFFSRWRRNLKSKELRSPRSKTIIKHLSSSRPPYFSLFTTFNKVFLHHKSHFIYLRGSNRKLSRPGNRTCQYTEKLLQTILLFRQAGKFTIQSSW
jgi:hypothetical protein